MISPYLQISFGILFYCLFTVHPCHDVHLLPRVSHHMSAGFINVGAYTKPCATKQSQVAEYSCICILILMSVPDIVAVT